jgi:anti-sigma-K factor RskA
LLAGEGLAWGLATGLGTGLPAGTGTTAFWNWPLITATAIAAAIVAGAAMAVITMNREDHPPVVDGVVDRT